MSLVGAAVTPHPPIIVPQVGGARLDRVDATVQGMRRLGRDVAGLRPDTLVLLSPHAPLSAERMGVVLASTYDGSLAGFGAPDVAVSLEGDASLGEGILRESLERGVPTQGTRLAQEVADLDHGSLVPLFFLTEALDYRPRLVLLTFSLLGTAAHLDFGAAVGHAVDAHSERVVFVASGDLSHRLTPDAPAGYNPRGREFDDRVVEAVRAGDADRLVSIPRDLSEAAGECGYRSLLVLFGLLANRRYRTEVLSYEGPFGVGYLVAEAALEEVGRAAAGEGPRA